MSKLLLIQAGKDAELESILVEKNPDGLDSLRHGAHELAASAPNGPSQAVTKGLSLQIKDIGGEAVVFDLKDALGQAVELSLPLSPALFRQKDQTERALKARSAPRLFAALAAEFDSGPSLPVPSSLTPNGHKSGRRTGDRRTWSRMQEATSLQNEADQAMLILKGVLQLARRDPHPRFSRLRLPALLDRTIGSHRTGYPGRAIDLKQRSHHLALGNPARVEIALSLLLNNAERYTPAGQPFEVDCFDGASTCSIALLDNSGEEHMERYLGPWDLYDSTPSDEPEAAGAGIGLSVGRQLVESMQGEFWCGHRREGGTAFVISLPRARVQARSPGNLIGLSRRQVLRHSMGQPFKLSGRMA